MLKTLFKNKTFRTYLYLYSLMMIFNYSMLNTLPVVLTESGYSDQADMISFSIGIITGILGAIFYIRAYIHKNNSQHLPGYFACGLFFYCAFCLNIVYLGPEWSLHLLYAAFSFFILVIQPLIYELTARSLEPQYLNFANNIYVSIGIFASVFGVVLKDWIFTVFANKRDANFTTEFFFLLLLIAIQILSYKVK